MIRPRSTREIVTRSALIPNINTLNNDVFTLIFQELIDEEADIYMNYYRRPRGEPKAAVTLALVCKRWKGVVYSTALFWPIIQLSMNSSTDRMQAKLDVLTSRAVNAPIDLHILKVHSHDSNHLYGSERGDDCCCKAGSTRIGLDFSRVSNVRRVRIEFMLCTAFSFLEPNALPFLKHVKWVELTVYDPDKALVQRLDLDNFLKYTPGIVDLRLGCVGAHKLSWALPKNVLMPNLRTLHIAPGRHDELGKLPQLAQILSHAPNLEELRMSHYNYGAAKVPVPAQFLDSIKCFPKLRMIETDVFMPVIWLFSNSGVSIPNLEEFCYAEGNLQTHDNDIRKFFFAHQSIKAVSLSAPDNFAYDQRLCWLPGIKELTIRGIGRKSQWLAPLYTPRIDESTGRSAYVCPNLRVLKVIDALDCLSSSSFEHLARVRCIPVDQNGYTAAGCRAIKVLRLKLTNYAGICAFLPSTNAWKGAEVRKVSDNSYELRWPYRPDETSVPDTLMASMSRFLSTLKLV